jgi:DNA end-binding protein Ku
MKVNCPEHGEIARSDTVRGYEWAKGQYVVIEESDFEAVPLKTVRSIEIEQFVEAERERHASRFVKQSYYLEPEAVGKKAFSLLREVLIDSQLQAICKIVLKDREQLAVLDPFASTMMLSTLYWPDEVRDLADLELPEEEVEVKPVEVAMARQLVDALTGDFDASRYHDEYREALLSVIEAKVEGQPVEAPAPLAETSKLTDLMAILEASVAAARGEAAQEEAAGEAASAKGSKTRSRAPAKEPVSVAEARKARAGKSPASEGGASGRNAKQTEGRASSGRSPAASTTKGTARRRKTA